MNSDIKKKILFLGYDSSQTVLIKFLRSKGYNVNLNRQKQLYINSTLNKNYYLIISFGYKKIIKKKFLDKINCPIINLHISYLPFNKGAHPNFWSFVENTPKGVTIHLVNEKIDNGKYLFRKKKIFKKKNITFESTYFELIKEIEKLFIKNYKTILSKKFNLHNYKSRGTFHSSKNLPKSLKSWKTKVNDFLKTYRK
jgi:folate-dependent phosphoribosylglycinamide formyltransferase PurN